MERIAGSLRYALLVCGIVIAQRCIADLGFSSVLTLGAAFQCLGFYTLLIKVPARSQGIRRKLDTVELVSMSLTRRYTERTCKDTSLEEATVCADVGTR